MLICEVKNTFLEKPLASSNNLSTQCLSILVQNDIQFGLGFLSNYTAVCRFSRFLGSMARAARLFFLGTSARAIFPVNALEGLGASGGGRSFYCSHLIHALL